MASGMYWLRFHTALHGKGKARALSDAEFRLLTRIWALGRESDRPGWVFVVEGVGWSARDLAETAGCKGGKPERMLERLVELRWIQVHEGGVIEVHDWEEHNPPPSPSKTPEARAAQKRKERATARAEGQPVATVSPGDIMATDLATGPGVATPELEQEQETEQEQPASQPVSSEQSRASPGVAEGQRKAHRRVVVLGPGGALLLREVAHGLGHGLVPLETNGEAQELERAVAAHGGAERAKHYVAATCRGRGLDPQTAKLVLDIVAETAPRALEGA